MSVLSWSQKRLALEEVLVVVTESDPFYVQCSAGADHGVVHEMCRLCWSQYEASLQGEGEGHY